MWLVYSLTKHMALHIRLHALSVEKTKVITRLCKFYKLEAPCVYFVARIVAFYVVISCC